MIRPLVFPVNPEFVTFLNTRGYPVQEAEPNIIHYFGTKRAELDDLMRMHKPDFCVVHSKLDDPLDYRSSYIFIVDLIFHINDIYTNKSLYTNNPGICQLYYQKLGLNREIVPILPPAPPAPKASRVRGMIQRVKEYMYWG